MEINEKLESIVLEAEDLITKEVIYLARRVLEKNDFLHEFIMCHGSYFFTHKTKTITYSQKFDETKDLSGAEELFNFVTRWDRSFGVTGIPLRFSLRSRIKTSW